MSDFIEEAGDLPSLLEIREFVVETMRRKADEEAADEQRLQTVCNGVCRAMFYLSVADCAGLHLLADWCTPDEYAEMTEDQALLAQILFRESIGDIHTHLDAWFDDFWESGEACGVHWHAFAREVGAMVLSVLTTQDRQHILVAYGESA